MDQQHPYIPTKTGGDNLTSQTRCAVVTVSVTEFSAFCCYTVGFFQHVPTAAGPTAPAAFRETVLLKPLTQFTATTSRKALASRWVYCRDKKCSQTSTLCSQGHFAIPASSPWHSETALLGKPLFQPASIFMSLISSYYPNYTTVGHAK